MPPGLASELSQKQRTSKVLKEEAKARSQQMVEASGLYVREWIAGEGSRLELPIAAAREQAVRAEEQAQQRDAGATKLGVRGDRPGQERREIPGDLAVLEQRRRAAEASTLVECHVTHDEVPEGWERDLSGNLGAQAAEVLRSRIKPLVEWLRFQAPEWVLRRSAELGPPSLGPLREAARHVASSEARMEELTKQRKSARMAERDSAGVAERDRAWEALARSGAEDAERAIGRLKQLLQTHQETLDRLAGVDGVLLALGYEDAANFHQERQTQEQIRLAQLEPRPEMIKLIGPRPGQDEHELLQLWKTIVGNDERTRIRVLSNRERGIRRESKDPVSQAQHDTLIDQVRAMRGIEARAPRGVVDALDIGLGA